MTLFWIADFGFWIEGTNADYEAFCPTIENPKSKIKNGVGS
jgi:hypothetical protein